MAPEIRYKRINLDVDVKFKSDGSLIPQRISYKARQYTVSRVLGQRPYIPQGIKCEDPIEFTTVINGREKKLYYEYSTNTWFSVKCYLFANRGEGEAQRQKPPVA